MPRSIESLDAIRDRLTAVEQECGPYDGARERFDLERIFVAALHTDNMAFVQEIDARVAASYQASRCSAMASEFYALTQWAGLKAQAAHREGHRLASFYFDDALRQLYAGGPSCSGVIMTLSYCVSRAEPLQSRQLRALLQYMDDFPQAKEYVPSYILAALAERGLLSGIVAMDAGATDRLVTELIGAVPAARPIAARLSNAFGAASYLETVRSQVAKNQATAAYASCAQVLGDGYAAFVLALLTAGASKTTPDTSLQFAVLTLAQHLDNAEKRALVAHLFVHPQQAGRIAEHFCAQQRIDLRRGGDSHATFQAFAEMLLTDDCAPSTDPEQVKAAAARCQATAELSPDAFAKRAGKRWFAHGRTLYSEGAGGAMMALKLPKHGNQQELHAEAAMMGVMAGIHAQVGLHSALPRPLGMARVVLTQSIIGAVAQQAQAAGQAGFLAEETGASVEGLLYLPPKDYERYLHQAQNESQLREASSRCLHDVAVMARHGWLFDAPADLFHNTEYRHSRVYHWNVGQLGAAAALRFGTGRLERSERSVQFPNYGVSGVRDAKQFKSIGHIAQHGQDMAGNEVEALMTRLGDMQFAWALSVARWYQAKGRLSDAASIAETLHLGTSDFFAAYTGRSLQSSRAYLAALVDWRRCAQQMGYFCSRDYIKDVARDTVRPGIYPAFVQVSATRPQDDTWSDALGWAANRQDRDLGPHNGPFPITELVRALYLLTSSAVTLAG